MVPTTPATSKNGPPTLRWPKVYLAWGVLLAATLAFFSVRTLSENHRRDAPYREAVQKAAAIANELVGFGDSMCLMNFAPSFQRLADVRVLQWGYVTPENQKYLAARLTSERPAVIVDARRPHFPPMEELPDVKAVLDASYKLEETVAYDARLPHRQLLFKIYRLVRPSKAASGSVGSWHFERPGKDESPAKTRARIIGGRPGPGKYGRGHVFTGDSYVDLGVRTDDFSKGFTIALWAYPTLVRKDARFFEMGNGIDDDTVYLSNSDRTNHLRLQAFVEHRVAGELIVPAGVTMNEWQHFAVVFLPSNEAIIYKNGSPIARGAMTLPRTVERRINYLGNSAWPTETFRGRMDEVHLFSRPLNPEEVVRLMRNEPVS